MLSGEVAHADRAGVADLLGLHQAAPAVDIESAFFGGPVDEVEVHVIQAEPLEAGLAGVLRGLESLIRSRQLGGDEHLGAG